ncbi:UNVERIFIED_CONTAM: hypothetical protein NCL1_19675 [Trichonephila clavipes]
MKETRQLNFKSRFNNSKKRNFLLSVSILLPFATPLDFDFHKSLFSSGTLLLGVAAVAEWYRYRLVADIVTSSSPVPLKTHRVEQRCTLNLSRAETSSRWCGVVGRKGGDCSGVIHVT